MSYARNKMSNNEGGTVPLTNFVTLCAFFFSKITTHWSQVIYICFPGYVSYTKHSKEPNYCTEISLIQVVINFGSKHGKY